MVAELPAPFLEEGEQIDRPAPGDESRIETVKEFVEGLRILPRPDAIVDSPRFFV